MQKLDTLSANFAKVDIVVATFEQKINNLSCFSSQTLFKRKNFCADAYFRALKFKEAKWVLFSAVVFNLGSADPQVVRE